MGVPQGTRDRFGALAGAWFIRLLVCPRGRYGRISGGHSGLKHRRKVASRLEGTRPGRERAPVPIGVLMRERVVRAYWYQRSSAITRTWPRYGLSSRVIE